MIMLNLWVKKALLQPVFNIGQLSPIDKRALDKQIASGVLVKGRGGSYPILKTGYALKGFDFAEHRKQEIAKMMAIVESENTK